MKWTCGVTTVPARRENGLPQTLRSLGMAGFDQPRLFVDGTHDIGGYEQQFRCPTTVRTTPLHENVHTPKHDHGPAGNWVLSMYELFIRDPAAERFALFQDDLLAVKHLRTYLERCKYPDNGYLNLFTWDSNRKFLEERGELTVGWHLSNQFGRGAVGLVFSREALLTLFSHRHLIDRFNDLHRGHHAIDGGIVTTMAKQGWKEYVHWPSPLQHTGQVSAFRTAKYDVAVALSFPSEDFDALDWLRPPAAVNSPTPAPPTRKFALGDMIASALDKVGLTKQRVAEWVGGPCGCQERQEKLNQLGFWAQRVLSGKTEDAEQHLNNIMGQK